MRGILPKIIVLAVLVIAVILAWVLSVSGLSRIGGHETGHLASDLVGKGSHVVSATVAAAQDLSPGQAVKDEALIQSGMSAQLVDYGTDKDTYRRGDTATGYISLKNSGDTVIRDVAVEVKVSRSVPLIGVVSQTQDRTYDNLGIKPGETRRIEFSSQVPAEYKGLSTAGDYTIHATIKTGGTEIGSFSKDVKVT